MGPPSAISPLIVVQDPHTGQMFQSPATFSFVAAFRHSDNNLTPLAFYVGTNLFANIVDPPFSVMVKNLTAGIYELSIRMQNIQGDLIGSSPQTITVVDLRITQAEFLSQNEIHFQITGSVPGKAHILDLSTDLTSWLPVQTNYPSADTFEVTDSTSSQSGTRFYRIRLVP
jgi:hypothetical protein